LDPWLGTTAGPSFAEDYEEPKKAGILFFLTLFSPLATPDEDVDERALESIDALLPPLLTNLGGAPEAILEVETRCLDLHGSDAATLEEAQKSLLSRAEDLSRCCLCGPQSSYSALMAGANVEEHEAFHFASSI
jgi:hypothetical protein